MKLVNCTQWDNGACALNLYGGRPSPGKCKRCTVRLPRDASRPALEIVQREASDDIAICEHRIAKEWTEQGQAILKAGLLLEQGTKWIVTREAWDEALKHRR